MDSVTIVIPNYKLPGLTEGLVDKLLEHYPQVRLLLIDNGSEDESTEYVRKMAESQYNVRSVLNKINTGHGPSMHQGVLLCETQFICLVDNDCIVQKAGGLERLAAPFEDPEVYAAGEMVLVDAGGNTRDEGEPYILPARLMIRREWYAALAPFNHHGAPAVLNIRSAIAAGHKVEDVLGIDDYFHHPGRGLDKGSVHRAYGIPGWHHRTFYLPEDAPTAADRLKEAQPEILGEWR